MRSLALILLGGVTPNPFSCRTQLARSAEQGIRRDPKMGFGIYSLYRAIQPGLRERRMAEFLNLFHPTATTRILDVGGLFSNWEGVPITSRITLLNPDDTDAHRELPDRFTCVSGDGCALPFADQSFDVVYSNSVIEHIPLAADQLRFAREALRVGRGVYVQTPYRWFPIEPHFATLFLHYLPKRAQRLVLPWCSFRGLFRSGDNVDLHTLFEELRLLSFRELQALFPDCVIHREHFAGLTKSLIAVRQDPGKTPRRIPV